MANKNPKSNTDQPGEDAKELAPSGAKPPLIFISHDSRDAELAKAFSKLLSKVSTGVLKSFRSSDDESTQGIPFGSEWYPKIMEKLNDATDVVCLLTPNSVDRPWILYEAGVAKGTLNTPVHGVAIGIPLAEASTGPFNQFQNCDSKESSLIKLVKQLVTRIPDAQPDSAVVKMMVAEFLEAAKDAIKFAEQQEVDEEVQGDEGPSVWELFEEIKVMFKDLPSRFDSSPRASLGGGRSPSTSLAYSLIAYSNEMDPVGAIQMLSSLLRADMPWLYEVARSCAQAFDLTVDAKRRQVARGRLTKALAFSRSNISPSTEAVMLEVFDAMSNILNRVIS